MRAAEAPTGCGTKTSASPRIDVSNQPGNHIFSDLCRGRSAMRRPREDHPGFAPGPRNLKPAGRG
nr:MAG TPA: hypothetical protein [Caudoviricetes sp.]